MSILEYLFSDDFVAGCIAGSIGIVATQPLDTIRIRCQVEKAKNWSVRQHAISITKSEGIRGLFRGVASPTLTVGLMSAILFQAYQSSLSILSSTRRKYSKLDRNPSSTYTDMAIAGTIAGAISCVITSPTELFKIKVQESISAETATMRQEFKEAVNLCKEWGIGRGIFRGLNVTIYRDAPAFAIYFPLYEVFVDKFDPNRNTQIIPFIGGGIAGLVSWAFVYPLDHVKTYYQTRRYSYGTLPLYKAIRDHMRREGGVHTIYKGLGATLLRCTPQHAVVFVCYEEVKKAMSRFKQDDETDSEYLIKAQSTTATATTNQSSNVLNSNSDSLQKLF